MHRKSIKTLSLIGVLLTGGLLVSAPASAASQTFEDGLMLAHNRHVHNRLDLRHYAPRFDIDLRLPLWRWRHDYRHDHRYDGRHDDRRRIRGDDRGRSWSAPREHSHEGYSPRRDRGRHY